MSYPPEMWTTAVKMITALALVIGFLFISLHVFKRMYKNKLGGQTGNLINILASSDGGGKKKVGLVEISKDAVDASMGPNTDRKKPMPFAEHLRRLASKPKSDLNP